MSVVGVLSKTGGTGRGWHLYWSPSRQPVGAVANGGCRPCRSPVWIEKGCILQQVATISLQTDEVLSALQHPVHLYALFSPGQEDASLISLLERYAAASPMVSFSQENLLQNPLLVSKVSSQFDDHAVTTDSLIVECADTGRIRVLDGTNYLQQSYDPASGVYYVSGLTYEKSLTEAILYVTADRLPVVQVLTGHDELDAQETAALRKLLTDANYECRTVSLASRDTWTPTTR